MQINDNKILRFNFNHFWLLVLGCMFSQKITIGGEIYVGEIAALIYLILNLKSKFSIIPSLKIMFLLALTWVFVQFISDMINQTPIITALKGQLAPVIFLINITSLAIFVNRNKKIWWILIAGLVLGFWINVAFVNNVFYKGNPWKWGLGNFFLLSFLFYFDMTKHKKNASLLFFSLLFLGVSVANSARSLGLLYFFSYLYYVFFHFYAGTKTMQVMAKNKNISLISLFLILMLSLFALDGVMSAVFSSDWLLSQLSADDAAKYKSQANSELGMILAGRSELLISLTAFYDAPLFGHGSWAESSKYTYQYIAMMFEYSNTGRSFQSMLNASSSNLIPTHSYLMSAIVWGGFFAGIFWFYMLCKLYKELVVGNSHQSILKSYLIFLTIWNILFSPFGADARWMSAIFLVIVFFVPLNYINRKFSET